MIVERAQLATCVEVGVSRPRKDADEKLRGQAQYVGDMEMAGMLHGKVLRSPYAHARISSIDASAALAMEGVAAILTAADLDDIEPYYGHAIKDRPIVAIDRVRFAGEPVAAVAAVDEATAEAAVRAIEVDYEQLPVLGTLEQALAPDAPRLHERAPKIGLFHGLGDLGEQQGNVCYRHLIEAGDVEAARAQAAIIVEGTYTLPGRLPVRDGDARDDRPLPRRRRDAVGQLPAPVPRAGRDRRPVRARRSARCGSSSATSAAASARSPTPRWSR